ncbi:branched-chain amino acid transport system substrate-binding protein [Natronocella acetinitrilica]|uniref:Branched-chain amino acid transport system substrate-binding protein n=1 Tax=Natronocella acetinitrilica TaxID=414046 RepID=A0AAE3G777_9GAMM|nr:ABC transporter substrate-binding protein [Natronocella acetinitrilica]MCP1676313.1 branched-chain amino acid transport system substrate-binding protein [Natronocella acetinitrilica]
MRHYRLACHHIIFLLLLIISPLAASSATDDGVVRILVITDLSGVFRDIAGPGSATGARLAAEDFSEVTSAGPVEIIVRDSRLDRDHAAAVAQEIHAETPLDLIVGHVSSGVALGLQPFAEEKGILIIHAGPASDSLTNGACSALSAHWGFDTYALAHAIVQARSARYGDESWFIITSDYAFGHDLEARAMDAIDRYGGDLLGVSRVPFPAQDFSTALREALDTDADLIALAMAGEDFQLAVRQAYEEGVREAGRDLIGLDVFITDVHRLGLYATAGLGYATSFYWDADEESRAFAARFREQEGVKPAVPQAATYSAVRHYLKAVNNAGTDAPQLVLDQMRNSPVDDFFGKGGHIRADGGMVHDMLQVRVRSPRAADASWAYLDVESVIDGSRAFRPLAESDCPLLR